MKKILAIALVAITTFACAAFATKNEDKEVKKTINAFAAAGDKNDVKALGELLDDNYRVVMNRLFGSETVSIISRKDYLAKIESKEWGGDKRKVTIENLLINGTTATAKVTFAGEKMTFVSLMTLIQNADGKWLVMSDMPTVKGS